MKTPYDDIINMPHHQSTKHPPMSMSARAAQFAPFSALVGYDEQVAEAGRLTDTQIVLNEDQLVELNHQLQTLNSILDKNPVVTITYFVPDRHKEGGRYVTSTSCVKKIDCFHRLLVLSDTTEIGLDYVAKIEIGDTAAH